MSRWLLPGLVILALVEVLLSLGITLPRTCAGDLVVIPPSEEPGTWWTFPAVARMHGLEDRDGILSSPRPMPDPGFYLPEWRGVPFGPFWLRRHTPIRGPDDDLAVADLVDPSLCTDSPLPITATPWRGPTTLIRDPESGTYVIRQGFDHHFAFRRLLAERHVHLGWALGKVLAISLGLVGVSLALRHRAERSRAARWAAPPTALAAALVASAGALYAHERLAPSELPREATAAPRRARSVVDLVAGGDHTCVLSDIGTVRCWGEDGMPGHDDAHPSGNGPHDVALGGGSATKLVAGHAHTCALVDDDYLQCWAPSWDSPSFSPRPVSYGPIAAGAGVTCANYRLDNARCWTDSPRSMRTLPFADRRLTDTFPAGVVSAFGACALGPNPFVIGDGYLCAAFDGSTPPEWFRTVDLGAVDSLAVGPSHMCAVIRPGRVRCWGKGDFGQLGLGDLRSVVDPSTARDVNVGGPVSQVTVGAHHTCALLTDGRVRCWGRGAFGQLGYGNRDDVGDRSEPADGGDVPVGGAVVQIAAGDDHTCARLDRGQVRCWGRDDRGQLGYPGRADVGGSDVPRDAGDVPIF